MSLPTAPVSVWAPSRASSSRQGKVAARRFLAKLTADRAHPCLVQPYQGPTLRLLSNKNTDFVWDKDQVVSKHFMVTERGMLFSQLGETSHRRLLSGFHVTHATIEHPKPGACTLCLEYVNHCRSREQERNKEVGSRA